MSVDDTSPKRLTIATAAGSIAAAVLASACCVGPLILALLGIGGGALLVKLEPLRPLFMVVTVALLGTGFYVTYRRRAATVGADGIACDCPAPRTHRVGRAMLWVAAVVVTGVLAFPYLTPFIFD